MFRMMIAEFVTREHSELLDELESLQGNESVRSDLMKNTSNRRNTIGKAITRNPGRAIGAGGFTLFELLTVLAILSILLGLTIPVLGRARKTAKVVANQTLMREVAVGAQQFRLDNAEQSASYFSAKQLGSGENLTRGFSPMQSVLLNLMGGIAASDSLAAGTSVLNSVGPTVAGSVSVNPSKLAAGESSLRPGKGAYLTIPGNNLKTLYGGDADEYPSGGNNQLVAPAMGAAYDNHSRIPELIDAFGTPILAWIEDERIRPEDSTALYAAATSDNDTARFYYASNSMYLNSPKNYNSWLATAATANVDRRLAVLGVVTGSPAFAQSATQLGGFNMPRASRSGIILHSAGPDGVWVAKGTAGPSAVVPQFPASSNGSDLMSEFDDTVVGVGN